MKTKELPTVVETNEDIKIWEEYLSDIPKEQLVDFMLDRMIFDSTFMKNVYNHFVTVEDYGASDLINAYSTEMDIECDKDDREIDVDYIVSLTRRFVDEARKFSNSDEKNTFFDFVIKKLTWAVEEQGAGMYADEDWLIYDYIEEITSYKKT